MGSIAKPSAVIFDWDNTLVDTWPIIHQALVDTFAALGRAHEMWSFEETKRRVKKSMRDSFPEIFGSRWEDAADLYQKNYRKYHLDKLTPLEGAENILKAIQKLNIPMFVVSNKKGNNLRLEVKHLGWDDYFTNIVGSADAAKDKPHCEPVLHALESHGFKPGPDVWFIGDSDIDLECAKNTGCTPILYGDFASTQPDYTETHYFGFPYTYYVREHDDMLRLFAF